MQFGKVFPTETVYFELRVLEYQRFSCGKDAKKTKNLCLRRFFWQYRCAYKLLISLIILMVEGVGFEPTYA